ncbi:MAG: hypothetical protein QM808_08580 [Steroidobacteraceae bacterium]
MRAKYKKKADQYVTAVQLNLELSSFGYRKWGGEQTASRGDWLVDNRGDVYTVEQSSFARTYQQLSPGVYVKTTPIWAERVAKAGAVNTFEGVSHYAAGDYLVSNNEDGSDAYCMTAEKFTAMYERDE